MSSNVYFAVLRLHNVGFHRKSVTVVRFLTKLDTVLYSKLFAMAQTGEAALNAVIDAVEEARPQLTQDEYSKLRNEREKATFNMMMRMNPDALTNIRKEFFARRDSVTLDEFIYIIQKHLINKKGDSTFIMETPEQREFGTNMFELFKDIDVNGDGQLEWQVIDVVFYIHVSLSFSGIYLIHRRKGEFVEQTSKIDQHCSLS